MDVEKQLIMQEKENIYPSSGTRKLINDYYSLRTIADNLNDGYDVRCFESKEDYYKWIRMLHSQAFDIKLWCKQILDKVEKTAGYMGEDC